MSELKPVKEGRAWSIMMIVPLIGTAAIAVGLWWISPALSMIAVGLFVWGSGLVAIAGVRAAAVAKLVEIEEAGREEAGLPFTAAQAAEIAAKIRKIGRV